MLTQGGGEVDGGFWLLTAMVSKAYLRRMCGGVHLGMESKPTRPIEDDEVRVLCYEFPAHALAVDLARIILCLAQT